MRSTTKNMWDTLYTPNILLSGRQIPHKGRLPEPTVSTSRHSALCGATIRVDLVISGNRVTDFAQEVDACILGRSAAALLGQGIIRSSIEELKQLHVHMHHLLITGQKPNFKKKWADLAAFEAVHPYPLRYGAVLLPFEGVKEAIDKHMEWLKTNA
jgi:NifU-like protein involved in Fe-S cluster formation